MAVSSLSKPQSMLCCVVVRLSATAIEGKSAAGWNNACSSELVTI